MSDAWLPIQEYSNFRGLSISTVRRYIKTDRIKYKKVNGKYLIWEPHYFAKEEKLDVTVALRIRIEELEKELRKSNLKVDELTMLVKIYEDKFHEIIRNNKEKAEKVNNEIFI